MVKKNTYHTVIVKKQAPKGDGIAYIEKMIIYIPGTLPNDVVEIKLVKVKSTYAYAKVVNLIEPGDQRVDPKCLVADRCGGCQLQHQLPDFQRLFKYQQLKQSLSMLIPTDAKCYQPMTYVENPWHFRNKMQFGLSYVPEFDDVLVGMYAKRTHHVVEPPICHIMPQQFQLVITQFKHWFKQVKVSVYDEHTNQGCLRYLTCRFSPFTGDIMVIVTVFEPGLPTDCLVRSLQQVSGVTCIYICLQSDSSSDQVLTSNLDCVWGKRYLLDQCLGLSCRVGPLTFMQSNMKLVDCLYQLVIDCCFDFFPGQLLDIYCGTGILSMALSRQGWKVTGVDNNLTSIEAARLNAIENNLDVNFVCQQAEDYMINYLSQVDVVVLDPPRQGCHRRVLDTLCNLKPACICYVSCNPTSLGRDLAVLVQHGYSIDKVYPVDMFCHTVHTEVVVRLVAL